MGEEELLTLTDDQISVVRLEGVNKSYYETDPDSDGSDTDPDSDGSDTDPDSDGTDGEPDSDGTD
jgi:hypothetical protein